MPLGGGSSLNQLASQPPVQPIQPISQPQPAQAPIQPINSDYNDVILNTSTPQRPRKKIVLFSCIFVALLLAGAVIWTVNNMVNKNTNIAQVSLAKESFNEYANYIMSGIDSNNNLEETLIETSKPYFEDLNNAEREQYVKNASQKFTDFSELYYSEFGKYTLDSIDTYFEQYASLEPLTENDIITEYITEGRERTQNTIDNLFNSLKFEDMNEKLGQYVDAEKSLARTWLNIVIGADESGCINTPEIIVGCYGVSSDEQSNLIKFRDISENLRISIKTDAIDTLLKVYKEIYGIEDDTED